MKGLRFSKRYRVFFILLLVGMIGLALPGQVLAATPFIAIVSVKGGESVTVHADGLPAGKVFIARMDKSNANAEKGTVVGQTTSSSDGVFDATYTIPAALKTEAAIAIRIDADQGGWYAYNWFSNQNKTASPTPPTPVTPTPAPTKMYIEVVAVEKNNRITVSASNFPANLDFKVRVGPYSTFGRDQRDVMIINSGKGGAFLFNVTLPGNVKDVAFVTIRLDNVSGSTHFVAYNAFNNQNSGTVVPNPTQPTPTPTPSTQASCQILSVTPTQPMAINADFDAVWEVKNTSNKVWDNHELDFRYQSGDKLNKYSAPYDLPKLVQPGETVKLLADMVAPSKTGTYSTVFVLVGDHGIVCTLPLTITVK